MRIYRFCKPDIAILLNKKRHFFDAIFRFDIDCHKAHFFLTGANKQGDFTMKKWSLSLMVLIGFLLGCQPMFKNPTGKAITVRRTDALLGPDWSHKLVTTLPVNTELALIGMERDWYEVQLPDGSYAWVYKQNVRIIPYGNLIITRNTVVRRGPGETFGVLRRVVPGTRVTRLELQGAWVRIALQNGSVGWIHTNSVAGL